MNARVRHRDGAALGLLFVVLGSLAGIGAPASAQLSAGPMVGHASETEVTLWVQTTRRGSVQYRYWPEARPGAAALTPPQVAEKSRAYCVHTTVSGLPFGTRYRFAVVFDGKQVEVPHPLRFRTQRHWRWRGPPPDLTVALGSCAYVNDPPCDRPGKPYGGDPFIFETIAAKRPDLMLWMGDNIYYREPDWTSEAAMRARFTKSRGTPRLQRLLATTHHYAIWDDHDYGSNDSDWTFPLRDAALRTFKLFWSNPTYGQREAPGVFSRFTWSDVEFFMLDGRSFRTPNAAPDSPTKTMFGAHQIRWLLDGMSSSIHRFKVIVSGNQVLNPLTPYEAVGRFPNDQRRILTGIRERRISGVLFLSGDRHHAELIRSDAVGYPVYDFTSSPLLSGLHAPGEERENAARVPGTLVTGHRNFGLLRFRGPEDARVVELSCVGAHGQVFWRHVIAASALQPR